MKQERVVILSDYRAQRQLRKLTRSGPPASRLLPDGDNLRELLDRNISVEVWKRGL